MDVSEERHIAAMVEQIVKEVMHARARKKTPLIVGNWKMNMTVEKAVHFFESLDLKNEKNDVVVCPPYPLLYPINIAMQQLEAKVQLGAQNMHWEDHGAHTGEVSVQMLREVGCQYVIIGHSERRIAGESNEVIQKKVKQALANGLYPIICVGESSDEFKQGRTKRVIKQQIEAALKDVKESSSIIIAYEPVWAIGTGKSATPEQAEAVHQFIRQILHDLYGQSSATIPILYGGSVNGDNAGNLAEKDNIDGVLVGGASLEASSFQSIIRSFNKEMSNA